MNEELIQALAMAARIACAAVTSPGRAALQASLDQACGIPAGFGWERKAAAHAEFFTALADAADDPREAAVLNRGAGLAYNLMIGAGGAANGIVISSAGGCSPTCAPGAPTRPHSNWKNTSRSSAS